RDPAVLPAALLRGPRRPHGGGGRAAPGPSLRGNADLRAFVDSVVAGLEDPIDPGLARTSSATLPDELLDPLVDELLKVPARVWRQLFAALLRYDDTDELHRIGVPTLLVWGDVDALVPRGMQDQLAVSIPDAEVRVYPGAGHTPRWDDPRRFADDLAAFAAEVLPASR
ncbi:MAG TPA: alpha/beta fold hydrolase, partial [Acidimicrobiales bacterium]